MSDAPKQETIVIGRQELDPEEAERYKQNIERARKGQTSALKGSTPLGHVKKPTNVPLMVPQGANLASPINEEGGVQPRPPGSPVIRPETAQQIREMADAQVKQQEAAKAEEKKEEDKEDLFEMFDFDKKNEADRILNNKKRRKEIEARCEPMKLADLILKDEVQQDVPVRPGEFVVRYRSITPMESLFIKKQMASETGNDVYLLEKYSIMQLVCSLVAINGSQLPTHLNPHGEPDEKLFNGKLKMVLKKSQYLVADLGVNYMWFDMRVRRLLNPDDLKNG